MKKCSRKIAMEYGNAYSNTKFICWRKIMSIIRTAVTAQIPTNPFHIFALLLRRRLLSVTALKSLFLCVHMVFASFPSCSAGASSAEMQSADSTSMSVLRWA